MTCKNCFKDNSDGYDEFDYDRNVRTQLHCIRVNTLVSWILLGCILLFLLFAFLPNVNAYTPEQQTEVCTTLNLSFVGCYEFWAYNEANYSECSVCENQTITNCTNSTTEIKSNCSKELEFVKQADATAIRLAEIEKGVSELPKDVISIKECDLKVADEVTKKTTTQTPDYSNYNSQKETPDYFYWIGAIIVLAILGYFYQQNQKKTQVYQGESKSPSLKPQGQEEQYT